MRRTIYNFIYIFDFDKIGIVIVIVSHVIKSLSKSFYILYKYNNI